MVHILDAVGSAKGRTWLGLSTNTILLQLVQDRVWSDRSGNSGYHSLGDTVAPILQGRNELCSATTQKPAVTCRHASKVSCVQCTATFVCLQENRDFTGKQTFFK
jgi:hypothetical protein